MRVSSASSSSSGTRSPTGPVLDHDGWRRGPERGPPGWADPHAADPEALRDRFVRRTDGKVGVVPDVPLPPRATPWPDHHEPTPFQRAVVEAAAALGPGELATYGELAEEAGYPGAQQAVGNVLRSAPDLPWWRVVPSTGRLYRSHAPTQAPLLRAEGHSVDEHGGVHPGS